MARLTPPCVAIEMPYRDDKGALHAYREDLERERKRVDLELARVRSDLDDHAARAASVRLADLRIASPCHEPWDKMTGDERARRCAKCELDVFDIANLTTAEAEALLATRGARLCVRFWRRADGTVMTKDCPVGEKRRRRVMWFAASAIAAGAVAVSAVGLAIATPSPEALATPSAGECLPDPPPPSPPAKLVPRTVVVPQRGVEPTGGPPPIRDDVPLLTPADAAALRIAGSSRIHAPPSVERAMRHAGEHQLVCLIRVSVDARGEVSEADVRKRSGYDTFDRSVVDTIRGWRFHPFRLHGVDVAFRTFVTVELVLPPQLLEVVP